MKLKKAYLKLQEACGIKVGDTVKVLRTASDYEMGWPNTWARPMNDAVGHEWLVKEVRASGFCLESNDTRTFGFPFYVLEKIEPKKPLSRGQWFRDFEGDMCVVYLTRNNTYNLVLSSGGSWFEEQESLYKLKQLMDDKGGFEQITGPFLIEPKL